MKDGRVYDVSGTLPRLGVGNQWPAHLFPPPEVAFDPARKIVDVSGGLHFTIATDDLGHVWEWGDIESNPALGMSNVPLQITPDSKGNEFSLLASNGQNVRSMAASGATSVAVKGDGTVWIWDNTTGGLQGDGTDGSATTTHPVQVQLPAGVEIKKIVISDVVVALDTTGKVWSWGGNGVTEDLGSGASDNKTPHALGALMGGGTLPPIVDIATGGSFSYALAADGSLYVWGLYTEIAGMCAGWCPEKLPILATKLVIPAGSTAHITSIDANNEASYAILSDGTLWAWGSEAEGLLGNGVEEDYSKTNPPYAWDWGKDDMLIAQAVQVMPGVSNFKEVFTGTADVFYAYALTTDGRLYSWGRNKTGDLGNGILPLNSQQAAAYPNSWDVSKATSEVTPFTATDTPTKAPPICTSPTEHDELLVQQRSQRTSELLTTRLRNAERSAPSTIAPTRRRPIARGRRR